MKYKSLTLTKQSSLNFDWNTKLFTQNIDCHTYLMCITPLNSEKAKIKLHFSILYRSDGSGFSIKFHRYNDFWEKDFGIKTNIEYPYTLPKYTNRLSKKTVFKILEGSYGENYLSVMIKLSKDYLDNSTENLVKFIEDDNMKFYYGDELLYKFSKTYRKDEMEGNNGWPQRKLHPFEKKRKD